MVAAQRDMLDILERNVSMLGSMVAVLERNVSIAEDAVYVLTYRQAVSTSLSNVCLSINNYNIIAMETCA